MPKRTRYDVVENDVPFRVRLGKDSLKIACCSCSLTHMMSFEVDGEELVVTIRRLGRETAALRRNRNGYLFEGEDGYKIVKRSR